MLTKADNELLTQVGPGTPMGNALRQYWFPILLSTELPEKDGAPLRLKLMGEDLVAFRDSSGAVGLVANNCPHRGASLFFGRNEEAGLRCVYHGWKFDVTGACLDMPNEPAESNFKNKVHLTAYPCCERNGVIWAHMGPNPETAQLPDLEWNLVPSGHVYISKRIEHCNWAQVVEGGIDTSHGSFLHRKLSLDLYPPATRDKQYVFKSRNPHFEVVDSDNGLLIGARREADSEHWIWGLTQFLMPFYSMIPRVTPTPLIGGHAWVPQDDERTVAWSMTWHPTRPLTEQELHDMMYGGRTIHVAINDFLPKTSAPDGAWLPAQGRENNYRRDFEIERTQDFSGIKGIGMQDAAMQEGMGAIYDRSKEHLGTTDLAIIRARQLWLRSAREFRDRGAAPRGANDAAAYRVRSGAVMLAKNDPVSWVEAVRERVVAKPGMHFEEGWGDAVPGVAVYSLA